MRILLLLLLCSSNLFASDLSISDETTLDELASKYHQYFNRDKADYLNDLIRWNPKWANRKIPEGSQINLSYPYPPHLGYGTTTSKTQFESANNELKINIGLAASYGSFTQNGSSTKINFKQNSPLTLQIMTTDKVGHGSFWDSSIYLSKIIDADVNGASNSSARIPYDFGANLYLGRFLVNEKWGAYFGYDFERFYLFDMGKLENQNIVEVQPSNLHYATLGLKYTSKHFFAKISGSIVVSASSQIAADISGRKWIAFIGKNISNSFGLGMFIKAHQLKYDDRSVDAVRYGISAFTIY